MLEELSAAEKAVGIRQTRKAVQSGRAVRVYLACDADPAVTEPVEALCRERGVALCVDYTMHQLGKACQIAVGASAVAAVAG